MKIAVICDVLGQENNGTTIAAMNLIRSLRAKGHTVRVVCDDPARADCPDFYIVPKFDFGPFNHYVEENGVSPARVDHEILESAIHDVDVIHVMLPFGLGKAAALYAQAHGIALTAGFHCQAENLTGHLLMKDFSLGNHLTYEVFYKRLYQYCDCIHYPTQFICDTFEAVVGPTNHRIISNGVGREFAPKEVSRPPELAGKYVVLFTGRYSREKSHIRQTGGEHIIQAGGIFYETEILVDGADGPLHILSGGSGHGRYAAAIKKDSPVPRRFHAV